MATGRDDFVIAFRSAFLKKKDKQKFSLLTLIFLSLFTIILGNFDFKVIRIFKSGINEIIYRSTFLISIPENKIKNIIRFPIKGLSGEYLESIKLNKNEVLPGDREFAFARYNLIYDRNNPTHFRKNNFLALVKEEKLANLKTSFDPKTRHLVINLENNILINDFLVNQQSIEKVEIFFQEYLNLPKNIKLQFYGTGHQLLENSKIDPLK